MTQNYLPKLQKTLDALSVQITVTDREGNSLIPENDICYALPEMPERGVPVYCDGRMYMTVRSSMRPVLIASCPDDEASRNLFILADMLIRTMEEASSVENDLNNAYQKLLMNELTITELDALADEYHMPRTLDRCVLLMHMVQVRSSGAYEILNEYLPRDEGDVLVNIDRHTAALIKVTEEDEEIEDLRQFAWAAHETLADETGLSVSIGIGNIVHDVSGLHSSYSQARRAMEIGRVFRPDESVTVYSSMMLERFLSTLSPETALHYHRLLFNEENERLFSEEMLQTIRMFFKKDLNLSDTARQLYIHRNTLVYRLDKVQRQTGLDLRCFDDAVTFRILYDMEKCKNNQ